MESAGSGEWDLPKESSQHYELEALPEEWLPYLAAWPNLPMVISLVDSETEAHVHGVDLGDLVQSPNYDGFMEVPNGRTFTPYIVKILLKMKLLFIETAFNDFPRFVGQAENDYIQMLTDVMGLPLEVSIPSLAIEYKPLREVEGSLQGDGVPCLRIMFTWAVRGSGTKDTYLNLKCEVDEDTIPEVYHGARLVVAAVLKAYAERLKREELTR